MSDLIRYRPVRGLHPFRRMIDRLWDETFDARWDPFSLTRLALDPSMRPWGIGIASEYFPGDNLALDLYEEGDHLVVKAALPGVEKDQVEVSVQQNFLNIRAKSESDVSWDQNGWKLRQRQYGAWQRSLRLPVEVDDRRAQAFLENGILTIHLPKRVPQQSLIHKIKVNIPKIKLPGFNRKKAEKIPVSHQ